MKTTKTLLLVTTIVYSLLGAKVFCDNPEPDYPKCTPHKIGCTSGNTAANGSCTTQGAYCIDPSGSCNQGAGPEKATDAICEGNSGTVPCEIDANTTSFFTGKCMQTCQQTIPLLSGDCKCALNGQTIENGSTIAHVKKCKS